MRRRALLSSVAAASTAGLAGCLSVGGGCSQGRTVIFTPVDPDDIADREAAPATEDRPELLETLVDRVLAAGDVEVETTYRDPLGWLTYYRSGNDYYEFTSTVVTDGEVTGPQYRLRRDEDVPSDPVPADTLSYAELPFQDRLRVGEAVDYQPELFAVRERDRGFESRPFVAGYLDPDAEADSHLTAGIEESYLGVDEGHFAIDDVGGGTASARRLAYAAEHVAGDTEEFADVILAERGTSMDSPPEEVEQLLLTAREEDGRLEVCDDDPGDEGEVDPNQEAANALQAYLSELESEVAGDLEYVRYEGEWHRIAISGWDV
ncbi:hypothetical protein AArcSl_1273 [Halalkaliarchaeum desulfuricum]|uniref:Uncharacterized protein n=1 Tax=Halalkaliarchaeum desulfuricum TaxID=2055893 RepID=A0A343TII3_9EURY|nr:hypothetical protein [Halalkaliarchaeum desulfuricum]AUX08905.1 hypothetical protein AArcSl_1273 [Halalkaliarchaeum desulfuricum]